MGFDDKGSNKVDDMAGKAKEGIGKVTGDDSMEAEGKTDQMKSSLKDAKEMDAHRGGRQGGDPSHWTAEAASRVRMLAVPTMFSAMLDLLASVEPLGIPGEEQ